jgi:flagellar motility protein MotE (MotC chaperone)
MNAKFRKLISISAVALLATMMWAAPAQAQLKGVQHAGDKITGAAYWPARASARHIESARAYAQEFQTYATKVKQPEPSVVKDIKTELGRYLEEGQKHLATMKKDLADDKEAVAAIEKVEKGLAAAIAHNTEMIACCENEKFDKIATMACCTDLVKELDKVHADHVALMKTLTAKYGKAPAAKK